MAADHPDEDHRVVDPVDGGRRAGGDQGEGRVEEDHGDEGHRVEVLAVVLVGAPLFEVLTWP